MTDKVWGKKKNKKNRVKIHHAHDRSLKHALQDVRVAKDFFRHHLPEKIQKIVHIETLHLEEGSFIDPELSAFYTDILYSVELVDEPEHGIAYIYLHLEHLSKEDPLISFRMVQYCVKIIDRHIKNHEAKKIPLIFPTVLYNGKRPFSDAVSIFDLFGENKELAREYMFDRFHLVDLSTIPDKEIRQHQWSCLLEMIFKHVRSRDIMTLLEEITDIFQQFVQKNAEDHVKAMLKYVIEKASIKDRQKFLTWVVKKLPKELEKEAMTLAEQWKSEGIQIGVQQGIKEAMTLAEQWKSEGIQIGVQQGVQQGIQQGVQQGIQQGTLEGERIILKKQLKWRFSSIPEKYLNKIDNANTKQLELFARKFLEAKTLEDIFGSYH